MKHMLLALGIAAAVNATDHHSAGEDAMQRALGAAASVTDRHISNPVMGVPRPRQAAAGHFVATAVEVRADAMVIEIEQSSGRILLIDARNQSNGDSLDGKNGLLPDAVAAEQMAVSHLERLGCKPMPADRPAIVQRQGSTMGREGRWSVVWDRDANGYSDPFEGVHIVLSAHDGSVRYFRDDRTFGTYPTAPLISESQAREAVEQWGQRVIQRSMGRHYDVEDVGIGQLRVAHPNGNHLNAADQGILTHDQGKRLVYWYNVAFKYTGPPDGGVIPFGRTMWIDAITGKPAGGF